jgi:hypothetical protein
VALQELPPGIEGFSLDAQGEACPRDTPRTKGQSG